MLSFFANRKKDLVLDFQANLLRELSATWGALQSRENPVKNIAAMARQVLDVRFLFTFVQSGTDDRYELHIFWCNMPTSPIREQASGLVRAALLEDPLLASLADYGIIHVTADPKVLVPDSSDGAVELKRRSFSLNTPRTSGMVGMGLGRRNGNSAEDKLAVESLLVALSSSACSARALSTYTREIERFATRDPLTNLYNQIAFWDLLNYETERSKRQDYRFSLLVIDLDNFKTVNDLYGHDVGDTLLKEFAQLLKAAVRAGDIAARYAGDQFIAILPVCDEGQAYIVARRILESVREFSMTLTPGAVVRQSVSIGIAVFPDHAKDGKDLYLLADSMLLQAKTFGKDRLSMPSEHDDVEVLKSMGDKNLLVLDAIAHRRIVPYFQPIMNMQDMKIEAYEVLTRIVLNDRVIPACEFIETAESMGAIGKIDYQLIEQAFAKVRETKYDGNLFLNLSPRALILNEFMPTVRKLLIAYGIEPCKMVFEITERDTVKGLDIIQQHITELRDDGFRFAIDDFGAGYSSFQYLRKFSVDFLKVDGDFIRNMSGKGNVEKAIVSSIAELSRKLGIKTIAEFVENEDILNQCGSAGIDYAQGYYIRRPSPELV